MAYVTDDKRVQDIIAKIKAGGLTEDEARKAIKALPPQQIGQDPPRFAAFGFLDWEVDEAIKTAKEPTP